ncbi:flagellar biosynthesis protein FlhB [Rhodopseudomonas boonkerdii]|uniref:flagellar biosynthesis protein FlhB n=1 Tax=Rhodopseudomonas boonkerdii TaxID=475937 RepID=UPI001E472DFE|nr:flagellar biosynthesis protein FlhB [Rhodopseudomonas boonkerdii]UGV28714.1 flagellar biosynthesis protein FlhB [Rhodopseudomonas boonkerdii]
MSEAPEKESKTEEATEKKVRDSVEKGQIPVSREAPIFASMLALLIIMSFLMSDNVRTLTYTLARMIDDPSGIRLRNGADAISFFTAIGMSAAGLIIPIIIVLMLAGLASSFLQNAPRLVFDRIQPQMSRLSIMKGWERIFGAQGRVEFAKSVFKFIAISLVVSIVLRAEEAAAVNALFSDPAAVPELVLTTAMRLVSAISIATIVLVSLDLVWARFHWRREMRMTKQEIKDEFKQAEGDPILKSRMRSLARDRARNTMLAAVPKATLVIANPTHFAIALKYKQGEDAAPTVLAKGQDLIALKIREIAEKNDVPVVEDKALARSMYDVAQIDRMIPAEFFRPVAEIIYFLHSRKQQKTNA